MTMPVEKNLTCYKGQTFSQNIYFQYKKTQQPIPLDGMTVRSQIRPSENNKRLTAEFRITVYGSEGQVNMYLDAETTAMIPVGTYAWDLKMTDGMDRVAYWIKGQFTVCGRVTE